MKAYFLSLLVCVNAFFIPIRMSAETPSEPKEKLKLGYVAWDVYMLGIDTPEKISMIRKSIKRTPVIGLVSYSGINTKILKGDIGYAYGPGRARGMHDTYQISEVLQIAGRMGIPVKIRVYQTGSLTQIAEAFRLAGKETDLVITYSSYWNGVKAMLDSVAANPDTLYISPYVEIGAKRTGTSFQGGARHPDGSGLRNFITVIPLSRHRPAGKLLVPSSRDRNDTETITLVAASSYASSSGETCPSAGVAAVAAAYIIAASPEKLTAEEIIGILLRNVSVPEERMLKLTDFNRDSVTELRKCISSLTGKDRLGIRRMEAEGIIDLWKIYQEISKKTSQTGKANPLAK